MTGSLFLTEIPWLGSDGNGEWNIPQFGWILDFAISVGREVFEDLGEAEAALQASLSARADLGIERDDRRVERVGLLHRLCLLAHLLVVDRGILDQRVETFEISPRDVAPKCFHELRRNHRGDDIDEAFYVAFLLPVADYEDEGFVDIELPQGVAETDGGLVFDRFRINRIAAVVEVDLGGDIPLLRVAGRLVSFEECIAHPLLKHQPVMLHLRGAERRKKRHKQCDSEEEASYHRTMPFQARVGCVEDHDGNLARLLP